MDKRTESARNSIKSEVGYSLKKGQLKRWIYEHGYTQPQVARIMGIKKRVLQKKLRKHELFNKEQIKKFVFLVGAEAAMEIIYFPTIKEKNIVWRKTFGKLNKRKTNVK